LRLSAIRLRQNVYTILDEVKKKDFHVEIERRGQILKIIPGKKKRDMENGIEFLEGAAS
jgi:hypothetical protein